MRQRVVWRIVAPAAVVAGCSGAGGTGLPRLRPVSLEGVAFPAADSATAAHLLDRFAFGPRPGDVAHVLAVGIDGWLSEQLDPARLRDSAGDAALAPYAPALRPPTDLYADFGPLPPAQRQDSAARMRMAAENRELAGQVMMSALARHVASRRQLLEVMTDFWTNHFNVYFAKGADRWLTADFVERAIRPHALRRFEDLLVATAQHPAMLVYLDNWQSVAPGSHPPARTARPVAFGLPRFGMGPPRPGAFAPPRRPPVPRPAGARGATGINENYARELMELHTLGVDGGYTQQDVIAVARILTGWGLTQPRPLAAGGRFGFEFHAWAHDYGEKTVLGVTFPAGHGRDEGLRLLHLLAENPATARHVSHELCARFVADTPPDGCVDAAVAAWQATHGDIRAVLVAIASGPDFWAPETRGARFKTPLEFVASAVRALGGEPDTTARLVGALRQLGETPFMDPTPTGYSEAGSSWLNSGALLTRMNLALALASGRMPGVVLDVDSVVPVTRDYDALVGRVDATVLAGRGSERTLQVIRQQIGDLPDPVNARNLAVALALGSPDFQKE